jgi:hypothetical protein
LAARSDGGVGGGWIPRDEVLTSSGGVQLFFTPSWSFLAKFTAKFDDRFDGEFAHAPPSFAISRY